MIYDLFTYDLFMTGFRGNRTLILEKPIYISACTSV